MIWILPPVFVLAVVLVACAVRIPTADTVASAPLPVPNPLADLPPMPETAEPVLLPGLLCGLGLRPRTVPDWITDPELIASIEAGLIDIPDDLQGERR